MKIVFYLFTVIALVMYTYGVWQMGHADGRLKGWNQARAELFTGLGVPDHEPANGDTLRVECSNVWVDQNGVPILRLK